MICDQPTYIRLTIIMFCVIFPPGGREEGDWGALCLSPRLHKLDFSNVGDREIKPIFLDEKSLSPLFLFDIMIVD